MKYDYLIVGAGLYGAVFARQAADAGKKVLVIDKRPHIAGNVYTKMIAGINVHMYGAHIFHTNDDKVWNNGRCSCGGEWVYEQAIGHKYDTDYIYKCDKCGTRYEFDEMR